MKDLELESSYKQVEIEAICIVFQVTVLHNGAALGFGICGKK